MRDAAVFWDIENYVQILGRPVTFMGRLTKILYGIYEMAEIHDLRLCQPFLKAYARMRVRPKTKAKRRRNRDAIEQILRDWSFTIKWSETIADDVMISDIREGLLSTSSPILPQIVILMTGDKDFRKILEETRTSGREAWVIGSQASSQRLADTANRFFPFHTFVPPPSH